MKPETIPLLYRKALQNIFSKASQEHPKSARESLAVIRLQPWERQAALRDMERMGLLVYRHGHGKRLAQVEEKT